MTARDYIDEVKLRLNRLGVTKTLNDPLILHYVNRARRDVQMATISLMPERYGRRDVFQLVTGNNTFVDPDTMQHLYYPTETIEVRRFTLPTDYIDIVSLWLRLDGNESSTYREARRLAKPEIHNVKTHCFNRPTFDRPIYAIEYKQSDYFTTVNDWCYISGFMNNGTNIFTQGNVFVEIYAITALSDFDLRSETEPILSADLEEFAIRQAVLYCLNDIEYITLRQSMQQQVNDYKQLIIQNYTMFKDQPIQILPSQETL